MSSNPKAPFADRFLRTAARLVPRGRRREWLGEWRAEVAYALQRGRGGVRLRLRLLWSVRDALHLRLETWSVGALFKDFRFAIRTLSASPAFTAVAVLTLALGIGTNTAMFSIVNEVLFFDPGYDAPEDIFELGRTGRSGGYAAISHTDYLEFREGLDGQVEYSAAYKPIVSHLEVDPGSPGVTVPTELVDGEYFETFGAIPVLGRGFLPEEMVGEGAFPVAVLSHRIWSTRFGSDPDLVGQTVRLAARPYTVVGIAPEGFIGRGVPGLTPDVWAPRAMSAHLDPGGGGGNDLWMTARIAEGRTMEQVLAAVDVQSARILQERGDPLYSFLATPFDQMWLSPSFDGVISAISALLLGLSVLVLLVACTNLAGSLMTRSIGRTREVAIRTAVGAGRGDLIRQFLTESVVLGVAGGVLGLMLGWVAATAITRIDVPLPVPVDLRPSIDLNVLLFTLGLSVLAGVLFGLLPAVSSSSGHVASTLRTEGTGASEGVGKGRIRRSLVVAQTAVSVVLVVAATLFLRSLNEAMQVDVGFSTAPGALVSMDGRAAGQSDEESRAGYDAILARSQALPGVDEVALVSRPPLGLGIVNRGYTAVGVEPPAGQDYFLFDGAGVSNGYFGVMGIDVQAGRAFDERDSAESAPVAVISRAAAERLWPGEDAVGRTLRRFGGSGIELQIVGVADDAKIRSLTEAPRPYVYTPLAQESYFQLTLVARGEASPETMVRDLVRVVPEAAPNFLVLSATTMGQHLDFGRFLPRMGAVILVVLGGLGLFLAAIGLYGMVSFTAARRTKEMGVRLAIGATGSDVVNLVVRGGLTLTVIGLAIGMVGALLGGRFLQSFLVGVSGTDPISLVGTALLVLGVTWLASYIPGRRAASVDPVEALRSE